MIFKNKLLVIKIIFSILCVGIISHNIDASLIYKNFKAFEWRYFYIATTILALQLFLTMIRWKSISQKIGLRLTFSQSFRLMLISQFYNQLLPTTIGGDALRAYLLAKISKNPKKSFLSVFSDRVGSLLALVVICILYLSALLFYDHHLFEIYFYHIFIFCIISLILIVLFIYFFNKFDIKNNFISNFFQSIYFLIYPSKFSFRIFCINFFIHNIIFFSITTLLLGLGIRFNYICILMLPIITLISSIPISIAGWGVRESALVFGFGLLGIDKESILLVSVMYGIIQILIGTPGILIYFSDRFLSSDNKQGSI